VRREQHFNAFRDADERTIMEQEAELKRVRVERDLYESGFIKWKAAGVSSEMWQARLDRAVEALREITRRGDGAHPATREHWLTAKRALAEIEESK
jgi:hypothetical protein